MNEPSFDSWTELKEKAHSREACLKGATAQCLAVPEALQEGVLKASRMYGFRKLAR